MLVGVCWSDFNTWGIPRSSQYSSQSSCHVRHVLLFKNHTSLIFFSYLFNLFRPERRAKSRHRWQSPQPSPSFENLDVGEGSCPLIQAPRRQAVREDRHGKTASELSKDHECHLAENPQNTSKFESKCINMHQNMWNQQLSLCSNLGIEMSISNTSMFVKYDQICLF